MARYTGMPRMKSMIQLTSEKGILTPFCGKTGTQAQHLSLKISSKYTTIRRNRWGGTHSRRTAGNTGKITATRMGMNESRVESTGSMATNRDADIRSSSISTIKRRTLMNRGSIITTISGSSVHTILRIRNRRGHRRSTG